MRLWIFAIGHARGTSEGALCDEYLDRAVKMGRNLGFSAVAIEELAVSKARTSDARMADEAKCKAVSDFLRWMLGEGQRQAATLGYVALPADVARREKAAISSLQSEKH